MATIHNSDLTKELIEGAKIQISHDTVPSAIAEKVVPVMEVNPKLLRVCDVVKKVATSSTGGEVIYTTPANKDFYLTGFTFSYEKNGASDNTSTGIEIDVDGVAVQILSISNITLTASKEVVTNNLISPVKLDRSSTIIIFGNFTVGVMTISSSILGYTVED